MIEEQRPLPKLEYKVQNYSYGEFCKIKSNIDETQKIQVDDKYTESTLMSLDSRRCQRSMALKKFTLEVV
jgi:hypothetical protein